MTYFVNLTHFVKTALILWLGTLLLSTVALAEAITTQLLAAGDEQTTRFEAVVSEDVGYTASVLPNPYRVMIDLANVQFDLEPGAGRKGAGLIKSMRYGVLEKGKSRIVVDTTGPVLITKSELQPAEGKKPAKIIVELMSIPEDVFKAAFAQDNATPVAKADPAAIEPGDIVGSTTPAADVAVKKPALKPEKSKRPQVAAAKPVRVDNKKVIVLDPGHGGMDPGALSEKNTKEKDVVLAFALALQVKLQSDGRHHVVLTRSDDKFISLRDRVKIARREGADLFVALHADTLRGKSATGTTIYTLSETASDEEAALLAQKENQVDAIAGIDLKTQNEDVADVLIDLAQRESSAQSLAFAKSALKRIQPITKMTGKPMRSAGFTVLKAPDVPSVLIELGFLSNQADEERLTSAAWRRNVANGFAQAIDNHFAAPIATANQ
jgi:N-acetylmuramoyl-L-alanine amidase